MTIFRRCVISHIFCFLSFRNLQMEGLSLGAWEQIDSYWLCFDLKLPLDCTESAQLKLLKIGVTQMAVTRPCKFLFVMKPMPFDIKTNMISNEVRQLRYFFTLHIFFSNEIYRLYFYPTLAIFLISVISMKVSVLDCRFFCVLQLLKLI